jgi:pimeloyl-ACP methyl ester carboxylesterase
MYGPEWRELSAARFLNWPDYSGEKDFGAVADHVIADNGIAPQDIVGGASLGGIVALEIAEKLRNPLVILVGSAVDASEINGLLRRLAPLATVTPLRLIQVLAGKSAALPVAMFAEADPDFVRAMCLALPSWQGGLALHGRIVRIHGANDRVIHCPADCHVIPDAGHLVAMTHAAECARIVQDEIPI